MGIIGLLVETGKRAYRAQKERRRKMARRQKLVSKKPHWGVPCMLIWKDRTGQKTALPEIYHYDEEGTYDARIRATPEGFWEVWIGRPGALVDDKVESEQEAKRLAEHILTGGAT